MSPIRVAIADDHPLVRDGLRALLEEEEGFEVAWEAATGERAVALAAKESPDVVVMDLQMPDLNGIDATRAIVESAPDVGVLVLTMFEDDGSVFAAMRAGALGYLLKGAEKDEVLRAIKAVAAREAIFGPAIAQRVIAFFAAPKREEFPFPELTAREREILDHIARGLSNREIAELLVVSGKTVANHVSNIFAKLQIADRSQAIVRAREAGLGRAVDPDTIS
jgi:DNA-binding NarL/FixJ family response regulator